MTSPNTIIADMQLVETNLRQQISHLNDEIAGLKSDVALVEKQCDELICAIEKLLRVATNNICQHDVTHRGGSIWEICDQCGAKWADDEGGRPKFKWPVEVDNSIEIIARLKGGS